MEFCVILPQKLNQRKKKLMNRTIIFILIWLLCMPCMAVAETSKELEEAIDKCKQECSALFDSKDTLAYGEQEYNNIPPYSNLVFDVELLEVLENK